MTIVFQGHVQSVEWYGSQTIKVEVQAEKGICPEPIYLTIPEKDRGHWLVGRCVSITAYAFDVPKPATETQRSPFDATAK